MAKNCWVNIQGESNVASGSKAVAFMSGRKQTSGDPRRKLVFKLDSGASDHMTNEENCFKKLVKLNQPTNINVAKNNESVEAWYKGSIVGVNSSGTQVTIKDVLYVPDLRANLISVKKLASADIKVTFGKSSATMELDGEVIGVCPLRGDFYELNVSYAYGSANICESEESDEVSIDQGFEQEGEDQDNSVKHLEETDPMETAKNENLESINPSVLPSQPENDEKAKKSSERERRAPGKNRSSAFPSRSECGNTLLWLPQGLANGNACSLVSML
nr:uncharacterized protein LOC115259515 [Aedes albopictus]